MKNKQSIFYYLRHHRTSFHDAELLCGGGSDAPLTGTSICELKEYRPAIAALLPDIDVVFTTALVRARQTTAIINEKLKKEVRIAHCLAEWHLGDWEGKPWNDFPHPFYCEMTPPNGEPRHLFRQRVRNCLQHLLAGTDRFLIVGHGVVFHEITQFLLGRPEYLETAHLARLEFDGDTWSYNELSYK